MSSGKMCLSCCYIVPEEIERCGVCGCLHFVNVDEDETDDFNEEKELT